MELTLTLIHNDAISPSSDVGPLLGGKIHEELGKEVCPAMDGVLSMAGGTSCTYDIISSFRPML